MGGITAGQVNLGPTPRHLTDQLRDQLRQLIVERADAPISVTSVMGDGEAYGFALEIKEFLEAEGHSVEGVDQAVYTGKVVGQSINPEDERIDFTIGHQS